MDQRLGGCISYLWLCNRSPQNIAADDNFHLLSHISGIRNLGVAQLDPLLWGVVQAAIKESARAEVRCEG